MTQRKPQKPKNLEAIYELSPVQEGILFHCLYEPEEGLYILQLGFTLRGVLEVSILKQAWEEVLQRHGVLRTGFEWEGLEKSVQVVYRKVPLPFEELDWSDLTSEESAEAFAELRSRDQERGFELSKAPLVRLVLARAASDLHYFIWSFHHILIDGWCLPLIFEEVFALYSGLLRGQPPRLPPRRPYREFIGWLRGQDLAAAEEFWSHYLAGVEGPTPLPLAEEGLAETSGYEVRGLMVPAARLESFARRHRVTVNTLVQGAWAILLARFADQREAVFGVTSSGRSAPIPGIQTMVGLFINTLPVRLSPDGEKSLVPWLQEIQAGQAVLRQYEFTPLVQVQSWSGLGGGQPLFEAILVFENYPIGEAVGQLQGAVDLEIEIERNPDAINYPLSLVVFEGEKLDLRLNFERRRFSSASIDRLLGHLRQLLEGMVAEGGAQRSLASLPLLSSAETEQLIFRGQRSRSEDFEVLSLHELFEACATRLPERVALNCGQEMLTYRELNHRTDLLAERLLSMGVVPEERVGLCAPRGMGLVLGILGILKAGAVYVPLDPQAPRERTAYIVEDARVRIAVVARGETSPAPVDGGETVWLEEACAAGDAKALRSSPGVRVNAGHGAYVIYTSGSTGQPKGVVVSHGNVARLFAATAQDLDHSMMDVWSLFHSFAFDVSVYEMWGALLYGGRLVVVPRWTAVSPDDFCDLLFEQRVTVLSQTPSAFRPLIPTVLARDNASSLPLRLVLFAGEMLELAMLRPWLEVFDEHQPRLVNLYGITETTVHVTVRPLTKTDVTQGRSVIGPAMEDLDLFVLNRHLQVVPPGVPGELCVGGPGLARCYLGQPRQTAVRFVPHPFRGEPGARLYRSGDLGRWLETDLEVLGRIDHQVKIRGFRIELGEIESALHSLPEIADAVVVAREGSMGKFLVAYVVLREGDQQGTAMFVQGVRQSLSKTLPDYMIPGAFVTLAEFPLTLNGKMDHRALARLTPVDLRGEEGAAGEAPRDPLEENLVALWAEILNRTEVGIHDAFFDLGGHSLLATRLISRLQEMFLVRIPLRTLFERPTVAEFSPWLQGTLGGGDSPLPTIQKVEPELRRAPLSFAQERLWFLTQLQPESSAYHLPMALTLRGQLQVEVLRQSLQKILDRHGALRTTLPVIDGEAMQVIASTVRLELPLLDLSALPEERREDELAERLREEAERPFDLARGPLLRCLLTRLVDDQEDGHHVLLATLHHIISDGWSMGVMVRELSALYGPLLEGRTPTLPSLSVQYADFAVWQRQHLEGEFLDRQLNWWRQQLAGAPPQLELPTDSPRSLHRAPRLGRRTARWSPGRMATLRALGRKHRVTLFMVLLAGWKALLGRRSGQLDLVVGTPIANRNRSEIESLIGFFVNTLALRTSLKGRMSFAHLLSRVREGCLGAYAHQDLPFERLVEDLQPERNLGQTPIFQVLFVLQNTNIEDPELPGLVLQTVPLELSEAMFDLSLTSVEAEGGLELALDYNCDLFDRTTMDRLLRHLEILFEAVVKVPTMAVDRLPWFDSAERHQLLFEWNNSTRSSVPTCLHELLGETALAHCDAVAVDHSSGLLSYGELARRSCSLALRLRQLGVKPEVGVGLHLSRDVSMVVALWAVLEAGGFYVPLDPGYPAERLTFMAADAGVQVVLSTRSWPGNQLVLNPQDAFGEAPAQALSVALATVVPENLAYTIYTSGSTGRPKGVAISHANAAAMVRWAQGHFSSQDLSGVLAATSISFDLSVFELFVPLASGGRVLLVRDALELVDLPWLRVRLVNTVPSAMAELVREVLPSSLRTVNLAGEPLALPLVESIYAHPQVERVFNLYGPSEDTTYSTWALMPRQFESAIKKERRGARVSIGIPVAESSAYVLDSQLQPVALGVVGELYLGGSGVSRGYLRRGALTAERYVPDPFSGRTGGRLYRTGDLVRSLASGEFDFLGRADHQVKVRGFRIELGEIEAVLLARPEVVEAVAVVQGAVLVAYVVANSEGLEESLEAELLETLRRALPEHMMPSTVQCLESMPRTPSGKIDRRALPSPSGGRSRGVAPRNSLEGQLARIFEELLGHEKVGVEESFFELGGHSILATRLVSRVREMFGVELTVRAVFEAPTVARLAEIMAGTEHARDAQTPAMIHGPATARRILSFSQRRLWFIDQMAPGGSAYNLPFALQCTGELSVSALKWALNTLAERHEVLRTRFESEGGEPTVQISSLAEIGWSEVDLTGIEPEARRVLAHQLATGEANRSFDLSQGPLLRAQLIHLQEKDHLFVVVLHHIVSDGWSIGVLVDELNLLYRAALSKVPARLPELVVQYGDYARWQRELLVGSFLERQLHFWREQLAGAPTVLELPTDRPRSSTQSFRGARQTVLLPASLNASLGALARGEEASRFMVLFTAWAVLLGRLSGQRDLLIGTAIANRHRLEVEGLIGFFVNTLVLRADLREMGRGDELLAQVKHRALAGYEHQDLPFERLVEEMGMERALDRSPLFQALLVVQESAPPDLQLEGLVVRPVDLEVSTAKFDVALAAQEVDGSLLLELEYATDLFEASTIQRWLGHFEHLLKALCTGLQKPLDALPWMARAQHHQLVTEWNEEAWNPRQFAPIHEMFEAQAERVPDTVAVESDGLQLSYRGLNERANQLAYCLRDAGVRLDQPVGLCMGRSVEMVVGMLGILKAGGAYVPLDLSLPAQRLKWIMKDLQLRFLVSLQELAAKLPRHDAEMLCLDADAGRIAAHGRGNPRSEVGPDHLAYIIYTSGSTGYPKGSELPHRSFPGFFYDVDYADYRSLSSVLQHSAISWDATTLELWPALLLGSRCVLLRDSLLTAEDVGTMILRHRTDRMFLTPSLFNAVVDRDVSVLTPLRQLLVGGDTLSVPHVQRLLGVDGGPLLVNGYGPSETTVVATCHSMKETLGEGVRSIPIGRQTGDRRVHVVGGDGRLVPLSASGELWIGGPAVARGYLRRPRLTAEAFVPDPFGAPGARVYRTGDRVRQRPDGLFEFLGRVDHQVKLRGFRVEPGEVEARLLEHSKVEGCAVLVREDLPGEVEKSLVAYVAMSAVAEDPKPGLRRWILEQLPEYMVPRAFVVLPRLPLATTGKVDRKALPLPTSEHLVGGGETYEAPRNAAEQAMVEIWEEILGQRGVGIRDNFFELGGHSLLATQVVSRIEQVFGVALPLRLFFEGPTVGDLAAVIADTAGLPTAPPMVPVPRHDPLTLSFAQERIWFLTELVTENPFYNMPQAIRLLGGLEIPALHGALNEILRRHESLRTCFRTVEGSAAQVILPLQELPLAQVDLSGLAEEAAEAEAVRLAQCEAERVYDLTSDLMLRAQVVCLGPEDHVLLLTLHHIAGDGWSLGVLVRELGVLYGAALAQRPSPLKDLPIQFADFAHWQRSWMQGQVLEQHLRYWTKKVAGVEPVRLPSDRSQSGDRRFVGAKVVRRVSKEVTGKVKEIATDRDATPFMVLLAAFQVLLARYSGQDDFIIGSPIANRNRSQIEALIGFFVNLVVLRCDLKVTPTWEALLPRVRATAIEAYNYQDLPFARLVKELDPERNLGFMPLVQVTLAVQNAPLRLPELPGLTLEQFGRGDTTSRFDLSLDVWEMDDQLSLVFVYDVDLFDATTVERMARVFENLLRSLVSHPGQVLKELPVLGRGEQHQLFVEWNHSTTLPAAPPISSLFTAQLEDHRHRPALRLGEQSWDYGEVEERANQLAHHLRARGLGAEDVVGICLEPSLDLLVTLLGIWKAGAAYLALDVETPAERLLHMVQDAGVLLLVTETELHQRLPESEVPVLCLDLASRKLARESSLPPAGEPAAEQLAYVIYTSGSTGRPKGVAVSHGSLANFLRWAAGSFLPQAARRLPLVTRMTFDACFMQLLVPLVSGDGVRLLPPDTLRNPQALLGSLESGADAGFNCVPSLWSVLLPELEALEEPPSLGHLLLGGEKVPSELVERTAKILPELAIWNLYGPSEATSNATVARLFPRQGVSVGSPIPGVRAYLVDRHLARVPLGGVGEVVLGGSSLARGYVHGAAQSAEKFVPDPFTKVAGERLYRTGDLGRYRPDGFLEILGRLDHQVKIRGFRIELGEVEAALRSHPAVTDCAVLARQDQPGEQRLAAYVVANVEQAVAADEEVENEQVTQWEEVFDEAYDQITEEQAASRFSGWDSSFTGEPIPPQEMEEWVETTVQRILAYRPERVLEIGAGVGLLLFEIAPHTSGYQAIDISRTAIQQIRRGLAKSPMPQVSVKKQAAHNLSSFGSDRFDTVVVNSVVQYFPDINYLVRVVTAAVEVVADGGRVFLGDVRSLPLLEAFHFAVQLDRASEDLAVEEFRLRVEKEVEYEEELVVAPAFFLALGRQLGRVGQVEIRPRRGRFETEMNVFRYDAILHVGPVPEPPPEPRVLDWRRDGLSLPDLRQVLATEEPERLLVRGVLNARLAQTTAARRRLQSDTPPATVGELRRQVLQGESSAVQPEEIWSLGNDLPYRVEPSWERESQDGAFDVLFVRHDGAPLGSQNMLSNSLVGAAHPVKSWRDFANRPLEGKFRRRLVPELRVALRKRLPEYMQPAVYMLLDELPRTLTGKVDRRALPAPDTRRSDKAMVAPRTRTEEAVAVIWRELLGLDQISVEESFFDLGGHSLLATQVMTRIRETFGISLSLRQFFETPTVAGLAATVEEEEMGEVDEGTVLEALAEIQSLSEEEQMELLASLQESEEHRG